MNEYKPLPDCLTIKESSIHGLGLFATEDIPLGTELGFSHIFNSGSDSIIFRTPLGGFYNHSNDPNTRKVEGGEIYPESGLFSYILITNKIIKEGEEITVKYTLYNPEKQ